MSIMAPTVVRGSMPQLLVNDSPGSSWIRSSPLRNAFGGHVIGSTARLRRLTSGSGSPVNTITYGCVSSTQSVTPVARPGSPQLDASPAVVAALEVREGVVQHGRADGPRPAEVVVRALRPGACPTGMPRSSERSTVRAGTRSVSESTLGSATAR